MNRRHVFAAAMLGVLLLGPRAEAGVYADDLAKCLVRSSSSDDHLIMIRWMFSAVTQHPALRSMSTVTPAQHAVYDRDMAKLTERLIFTDCRKEALAGLEIRGGNVDNRGLSRPRASRRARHVRRFTRRPRIVRARQILRQIETFGALQGSRRARTAGAGSGQLATPRALLAQGPQRLPVKDEGAGAASPRRFYCCSSIPQRNPSWNPC